MVVVVRLRDDGASLWVACISWTRCLSLSRRRGLAINAGLPGLVEYQYAPVKILLDESKEAALGMHRLQAPQMEYWHVSLSGKQRLLRKKDLDRESSNGGTDCINARRVRLDTACAAG